MPAAAAPAVGQEDRGQRDRHHDQAAAAEEHGVPGDAGHGLPVAEGTQGVRHVRGAAGAGGVLAVQVPASALPHQVDLRGPGVAGKGAGFRGN